MIEKANLDLILRPPKSTLQKYFFNPNAWAAQLYNIVEYLAQAPCAMSTLEVLQSFPTQRKKLLMDLGALDLDNTNLIHFNVDNYKSILPHQLTFQIETRIVGRKAIGPFYMKEFPPQYSLCLVGEELVLLNLWSHPQL